MIGAVDIGGTKIATALVDDAGHCLAQQSFPTAQFGDPKLAVARIVEDLQRAASEQGVRLRGVGVGCTGPVDPLTGIVGNVDLLPGWEGLDLVGALASQFQLPVAMENDADAAALAEARWGAGRRATRFLYVTISTGIGGGLLIDGQLYRGVDGAHPEIGHHVIDPSGPQCYCGARGCWEVLAAGGAMVQWALAQRASAQASDGATLPDAVDGRGLCELAAQGHPLALRAIEREGYYLGLGLVNLITIFCPDVIALGGGVMHSAELFLDRAAAVVRSSCGLVPHEKTTIRLAELGRDVALCGAASVWRHRFDQGTTV